MDDFSSGERRAHLAEHELLRILARHLGYEYADLEQLEIDSPFAAELVAEIPSSFARQRRVFPVRATDDTIWVAMTDPLDITTSDELERITGKRVTPVVAFERAIEKLIQNYYV